MMRTLSALLTAAAIGLGTGQAQAGDCGCHADGVRESRCDHKVRCPNCHEYCQLSVEKEKETKSCWEVECKPICIPRIRFPWESCCEPPKCAKVKYVHVLKKVEYECENCKYKWEPVCHECGVDGHGHACEEAHSAPKVEETPPSPPPVTTYAPPLPRLSGSATNTKGSHTATSYLEQLWPKRKKK